MPDRTIAVIRQGYDDSDGLDTGVSDALLRRVGDRTLPESFRISTPGNVVAFGKQDLLAPGFRSASDAARRHGFTSVIRLPGGRAAAFHEQVISFSWTVPTSDPVREIRRRFAQTASLVTRALEAVGIEASIGELPWEYCAGEFSVNHAERVKLAGIGQRLGKGAAHVGGVLVVGGSDRVRDVLVPVYDALEVALDPTTIGALHDIRPGLDVSTVTEALIGALSAEATITESTLDEQTLDLARALAVTHMP